MNKGTDVRPLVLVCPLNWGLGHATRCVPLIKALLKRSCRVMVLADGLPLAFLREYFGEQLSYHVFPGRSIRYASGRNMAWVMLRQLPGLLWSVWKEHRIIGSIVRKTDASALVSDNRYGLFHKRLKCAFMTHQLFIRVPGTFAGTGSLVRFINHWFIKQYDVCWVPDWPGQDNLSGELSHKRHVKGVRFIGPLSRFMDSGSDAMKSPLPVGFPSLFYLVILSGPEPQRSLLEEKLLSGFRLSGKAAVFVRGLPGKKDHKASLLTDHILFMDHAPDAQLAWLIRHSKLVVCRPGYSGIMDLAVFGKKALVIPTPGQTEQEYLAEHMAEKNWVAVAQQHSLKLEEALLKAVACKGIPSYVNENDLAGRALDDLIGR